jgi:hypothetical protein
MPKAGQSAAIKKTAIALIAFTIRFDERNREWLLKNSISENPGKFGR